MSFISHFSTSFLYAQHIVHFFGSRQADSASFTQSLSSSYSSAGKSQELEGKSSDDWNKGVWPVGRSKIDERILVHIPWSLRFYFLLCKIRRGGGNNSRRDNTPLGGHLTFYLLFASVGIYFQREDLAAFAIKIDTRI
ncbi:hypothetical protein K1719_043984 [Acacia pycnantha]|nr:hypothetical protein K1719_043984 [Acacia pycnantha]